MSQLSKEFQRKNMDSVLLNADYDRERFRSEMISWLVEDIMVHVSNITSSAKFTEMACDLSLLAGMPLTEAGDLLHGYCRAFLQGGRDECRRKYKLERNAP